MEFRILGSFEEGRILASLLPTAKLLPLESNNHILLPDEPAWTGFLAEAHAFLGAQARESSALSGAAGGGSRWLRESGG